jgi:hypothetical protein
MKNRLLTFAGALALLAVLGRFYAVPVMAQVRAALVKNIDERGRIPYTQFAFCSDPLSGSCTASFSAVPSNKRLVIEHVNLFVDMQSSSSLLSNVLFGDNFGAPLYIFGQLQSSNISEGNIYVANQPLLAYFEAGQTPFFGAAAQSTGSPILARLWITGYLVDLTQ